MFQLLPRCILLTALVMLGSRYLEPARAAVELPNIFSDHMVLQRGQANRIWGKADPGESVVVEIDNQRHEAAASAAGEWEVFLSPMQPGPARTLLVKGDVSSLELRDILVGDVWICSGQSNMRWKFVSSSNYDLHGLTADHPGIRLISFPRTGSPTPVWSHPGVQWQVCTPESVRDFSAVGYYFGRQVHETINVPIGLINNAWGGSACEAWINPEKLQSVAELRSIIEEHRKVEARIDTLLARQGGGQGDARVLRDLQAKRKPNRLPGYAYSGILRSHLGYGIRGVIWYQGEANVGRARQYRQLFPLLIESWRDEWGQGDFPFYWAQLADYRPEHSVPQDSDWAELREAQTNTMEVSPKTGQAVVIDLGDGGNIHPREKEEVGLRLARWALAKDYGVDIACHCPSLKSATFDGDRAVLDFNHVGGRWKTFDQGRPLGFAVAGQDRRFYWADAEILEGNRVAARSPRVSHPVAVRYAWADNPVCNLYNASGLPLTPFRTDSWDRSNPAP